MKKDYLLSEREGLALAMEQLLHYNVWTPITLDESIFEEEALLKYLNADFGSQEELELENIICAAVNRTVYSKNYIPQTIKKELSKKCQRLNLDSLRLIKINYHEQVKGMSRREAQARAKNNKIVKRISIVDGTVKWGIRKGFKVGVSTGVGWLVTALAPTITVPAWLIGMGTYIIISLLPDNVKNPVRKFVANTVDSVAMTAKNIASELAKRAVNVGKKAISTIEKTRQVAKQVWEDTKVIAQQAWEDTKVVAQQEWEKTKKIGNKIKNFFGF